MERLKKVVIVGGVAGGATLAARLRRLDEQVQIVMFERGEFISFANCGLPYHVGGVIPEREQLLLLTPQAMKARFKVDVRTRTEVVAIDREAKEIEVRDLAKGRTYRESYDHLVLSTGAAPVRPPIPGIDLPSVFSLRTIPDMDAIIAAAGAHPGGRAAVVGGGFIGLEMAENLRHRGFQVSLIEMADQVMTAVDREMAALVHHQLRTQGVDLRLKEAVTGLEQAADGTRVQFRSGNALTVDMVILAIGVRPESKLAAEAGLTLGPRGGIQVDAALRTSDPNISAVGDAAEVPAFGGGSTWVPLAGPANRQARLLADRLAGREIRYSGIQGTSIAKVFDLTVAATGKNEAALKREGIAYQSIITNSNSHAGYYPGAIPITLKLLFSPEGKVLGAQAVGYDGVDKRIDVIATAMRMGATVDDLAELELAYAPPFSSAKDPVNIIGYAAGNVLRGEVKLVDWRYVLERDPEAVAVLDVRTEAERLVGTIEGSLHIPLDYVRHMHDELPEEKEIVVYCAVGQRAHTAVRTLTQLGYNVSNLSGGLRIYQAMVDDLKAIAAPPAGPAGGKPAEAVPAPLAAAEVAAADTPTTAAPTGQTIQLNACGLQCPGPIMQVYQKMQTLADGDVLEVAATDPGFVNDIGAWCDRTGNTLLRAGKNGNRFEAAIRKGREAVADAVRAVAAAGASLAPAPGLMPVMAGGQVDVNQDKTLVVFSNDLDRAIASFIIANGAAAMGRQVTMFFTFWGLNILRKPDGAPVKKSFLDRMFSGMMPRGTRKLSLSKMNMLGIGPKLIRFVMGQKGVTPLEDLIRQAQMAGVRLVACNMSMDIMGIKAEELIDGVEIGGVASYLAAAEQSNVNLFV
jgi:NADPH-dependent 2,4-dienoyl-CoA reductase/sulfur reductase-like enzyme/peroxiredoxin family protein/rhodanese-related sulfurtransferase/TusA-related sulfurtransferase